MDSRVRFIFVAGCVAAFAGLMWNESAETRAADGDAADKTAAMPVEPDMHEFMEYVFQPTYRRLKKAMAGAPTDNAGWKAIKADALCLAESGNLLLIRKPKTDVADWVKHSIQVRDFGGQMYRAAKAKDYATTRKTYESMLDNCNACHKQFENGKHILAP